MPHHMHTDVRQRVASAIEAAAAAITADAAALFSGAGDNRLDAGVSSRLAGAIRQLLAIAVRDGRVDPRGGEIAELRAIALERSLSMERLFACTYTLERAALDELAVSETMGPATDVWPLVAQLIRRASFDLLAALAIRAQGDPETQGLTDALTTLHSRPLFDAVLLKEAQRAGRTGEPLSLILFDVDRMTAINEQYGYGVGDRILERLGILIRQYFRHHDWPARYSGDAIVVLLTGSGAEHAGDLAERVRVTVSERLRFTDHRTGDVVPVTVSGAVLTVPAGTGGACDPERLLIEAETALARAQQHDGNRVEIAAGAAISRTLLRSSPST
jgi:diguanylate cyclase (GGDEF)-like protein